MPGVRTTRSDAAPVGVGAARDRWPLRAQAHDVLAVEQHPHRPAVLVGQRAGGVADDRVQLAAEGAAVGQRACAARRRARTTTRRVRGRRAPPSWCAASPPTRPAGPRAAGAASTVVRRPCTLPARARASASVAPTAQPPAPSGTATRASGGAVSSLKPPWPRATRGRDELRAAGLERGPGGGGVEVAGGDRRRRRCARSHASRIVRQPVQRHRWASSACSTAAWSAAGCLARSPSSRHTMPGRAEAALAGPGGAERGRPAVADRRRRARRRW